MMKKFPSPTPSEFELDNIKDVIRNYEEALNASRKKFSHPKTQGYNRT